MIKNVILSSFQSETRHKRATELMKMILAVRNKNYRLNVRLFQRLMRKINLETTLAQDDDLTKNTMV